MLPPSNLPTRPLAAPWLERRKLGLSIATWLLVSIMLLSTALHFANIASIGEANAYYTAAVKSMLQSWHNFFFAAAEPGGSVTVDKPPLGLWVETAFAFVLGVNGLAASLPNILAGIFSVPLLYHLVRKTFGALAGLVAALVLVLTPVALAAGRNNTMDGLLVFTLLLAAWAFLAAAESGSLRSLLLGAFVVGLGFEIKMMQAYLVLPAFYALYFLGAKVGWGRKILYLGLASLVVLAVSLAWPLAVDLTPVDQRPYVGSSSDNTVTELIVGHNGLSRLFGRGGGVPATGQEGADRPTDGAPGDGPLPGDRPMNAGRPQGAPPAGMNSPSGQPSAFQPPVGTDAPRGGQPPQGAAAPGGGGKADETGPAGLLRFFRLPLAKEASWTLPLGLVCLAAVSFAVLRRREIALWRGLLLWGGWLLTCLVFFSVAEFYHAYYLIMIAPALGAIVGAGVDVFWRAGRTRAMLIFWLAAAGTIAYQIGLAFQMGVHAGWLWLAVGLGLSGGACGWIRPWRKAAWGLTLAAVLVVPLGWTALTVLEAQPNIHLPAAYAGGRQNPADPAGEASAPLLEYLQANTQDTEYLLAVSNANQGAPYVLASGRPVLYMGGFSGSDPVVSAGDLRQMVAEGELRYVLYGERGGNQEIASWLATSCTVVNDVGAGASRPNGSVRAEGGQLYRCGEIKP